MVKGTVSMVSTYKSNPDAKMVIEVLESEKGKAILLDKRNVVIIGEEEFAKLAESLPDESTDPLTGE